MKTAIAAIVLAASCATAAAFELCSEDSDGGKHCRPISDSDVQGCLYVETLMDQGKGWKSYLHSVDQTIQNKYGSSEVCTRFLVSRGSVRIVQPPPMTSEDFLIMCAPIAGRSPCF